MTNMQDDKPPIAVQIMEFVEDESRVITDVRMYVTPRVGELLWIQGMGPQFTVRVIQVAHWVYSEKPHYSGHHVAVYVERL